AAIPEINAICLAADDLRRESVRYQLAQLLAAPWARGSPPLLQVGLPTWAQGTLGGVPIDAAARSFLEQDNLPLRSLLESRVFFAEEYRHACYALAGSFTGYLIRHYGFERYRSFHRRCGHWGN